MFSFFHPSAVTVFNLLPSCRTEKLSTWWGGVVEYCQGSPSPPEPEREPPACQALVEALEKPGTAPVAEVLVSPGARWWQPTDSLQEYPLLHYR